MGVNEWNVLSRECVEAKAWETENERDQWCDESGDSDRERD